MELKKIREIFDSNDQGILDDLTKAAQTLTRQYFGRTISLYAPLYISNYCENNCLYCGFNVNQQIARKRLSPAEIENECRALSESGIQNLLILTGESRKESPVSYIIEAVTIAKKYFPNIAVEIYPLETEEYRELFEAGVDGLTIYQETYNKDIYKELHLSGKKQDYDYRFKAPERAAEAGLRYISIGVLLGLAPWQEDIEALFDHLRYLEKKYPGVEYSLSFPRMQKITDGTMRKINHAFGPYEVSDREMIEIICTARLLFPRVGINLSTRERADFRDRLLGYGVTKMSAGSMTCVGGYTNLGVEDKQFSINDERSVAEIRDVLIKKEFDPVFTDWRRIYN